MMITTCKYCTKPGMHGESIGCPGCWEIATRIEHEPVWLLKKIFAAARPELEARKRLTGNVPITPEQIEGKIIYTATPVGIKSHKVDRIFASVQHPGRYVYACIELMGPNSDYINHYFIDEGENTIFLDEDVVKLFEQENFQ